MSLELLTRGDGWVNRRVSTITLLDEHVARQQLSVDFRLPEQLPGGVELGGQHTYFLPLTFLPRRDDLAFFDVRDENSGSLPLLTRQENSRLTGLILIAAARVALQSAATGLELSDNLTTYLAAIPKTAYRENRGMVRSILDPSDQGLYPDGQVAAILLNDGRFMDLLGMSATCSALHIALTSRPGERRIIRLAWQERWQDQTFRWETARCKVVQLPGWAGHQFRILRTLLGWRPEPRVLPTPFVGQAESYHVQISVPDNVELTEAGMRNTRARALVASLAPDGGEALRGPRSSPDEYEPFIGEIAQSQHLYIEGAHEQRAGIMWVRLRAARHGFLRAAFLTAFFSAALLGAYALRSDNIIGESETAAALLLVVPALIAGFLIRPGEHAMARHLLRGPRVVTAVVGALPLLAAGLLVTAANTCQPLQNQPARRLLKDLVTCKAREAPGSLVYAWALLAVVAAVATVMFFFSNCLPRAGRRGQPPPASPADGYVPPTA